MFLCILQVLNHSVNITKCCSKNSIMTERGCTQDLEQKFDPSVGVLIHNSTHVNDEPVTNASFTPFVQNINCIIGS